MALQSMITNPRFLADNSVAKAFNVTASIVANSSTARGKVEQEELLLDSGATSFMFVATGLVQLMTPGLSLFYAGMVGSRSVISMMFQVFVGHGIVFMLWVIFGFSLTFGEPFVQTHGYNLLGTPSTYFMWRDVGIYTPLQRASEVVVSAFPGMLFATYQGMFAVITPSLMCGAFADRMKFWPYVALIPIWLITVYCPLGYWNWGGGWMFQIGAWDFAGGIVVHESAGFSSLAALVVLGNRVRRPGEPPLKTPHNIPMVLIGTSLLWFGWFGFNGGSALTIGGLATIAFVNTQIAPSCAMVTWVIWDQLWSGKVSLLGACSGAVAGMVSITPCAGFVQPGAAALVGITGGTLCFLSVKLIDRLEMDDACDTVGVHGMGGFLGMIFVGIFADPPECMNESTAPEFCANPGTVTRSWQQLWIQFECAVFAAIWSFVVTYFILKIMICCGIVSVLQSAEEQESAQDYAMHGEDAYVATGASYPLSPNGTTKLYADDDDDDDDVSSGDESHVSKVTPKVTPRPSNARVLLHSR